MEHERKEVKINEIKINENKTVNNCSYTNN